MIKTGEEVEEGDYVMVYTNHDSLVCHGIVMEFYDIPSTFGRILYYIFTNKQEIKSFNNGFWKFKILSKGKVTT